MLGEKTECTIWQNSTTMILIDVTDINDKHAKDYHSVMHL